MLLAAGEVGLRERVLGVAHNAQIALNAALENDAGLGVALDRYGEDACLAGEKIDDRLRIFRRNEEVDVADDFLVAAQAAGGAAADDVGMGAELLKDGFGKVEGGANVVVRGVVAAELNTLEDFRLGLFAEAGQLGELAVFACLLECLDGLDAKFAVNGLDLFRPQAGDVEHGDEAVGDRGLELVVIGEAAGGGQLGDLLSQRLADALDVAQAFLLDELGQRLGEALESARAVLVGARLERVLTLQLEEHPDLLEDVRNLILLHRAS